MSSKILVVSNEKTTVGILSNILRTEGYSTMVADGQTAAEKLIEGGGFCLMIWSGSGGWDPDFEIVANLKASQAGVQVIIITDKTDAEMTARAIALEPFACIEKPLKLDQLMTTVQQAIDHADAAIGGGVNMNLQLETTSRFENVIAESPAMRSVCDMISRIAATNVSVLISGDKGTGKSVLARTVHMHSRRKDKPFSSVDCASPDAESNLFESNAGGAIEKANGGTLYLKQIDLLSLDIQAKVAKVVEEGEIPAEDKSESIPVDFRLIASTCGNLSKLAEDGGFNNDLYGRLKLIELKIPALHDRPEDILPTIKQVIRAQIDKNKYLPNISSEAIAKLKEYAWLGGVSEIEDVIRGALEKATGGELGLECLPPKIIR
ncbi:MAG: sigma-54-dependent Fis family transcriptional regulator [Kiritimatiellae bacterium]|nr:sigma-54-dependent Fis family transcriptional regulator [Kiritimatiellia bacterium]